MNYFILILKLILVNFIFLNAVPAYSKQIYIYKEENKISIGYHYDDSDVWSGDDVELLRDKARNYRQNGYSGHINIKLPPKKITLKKELLLNSVFDGGSDGITSYSGVVGETEFSSAVLYVNNKNYNKYNWPIYNNKLLKNNRYPNNGSYLKVKKWSADGYLGSKSYKNFIETGYVEVDDLPPDIVGRMSNARFVVRKEFAQEIIRIKEVKKVNEVWRIFLKWPDGKYSFERLFPRKSVGDAFFIEWNDFDVDANKISVPVLENLIKIDGGAKNINFYGIRFHGTKWDKPDYGFVPSQGFAKGLSNGYLIEVPGAIEINNASHISFVACDFYLLGAHAIKSNNSINNILIKNCHFREIAGGGIYLEVNLEPIKKAENKTSDIEIKYNIFENIGIRYVDSVGIFAGYVSKLNIMSNYFRNLPYSAVSVGWGWEGKDSDLLKNNISHNIFDKNVAELSDGGDIYILSNQPESIIEGNFIIPTAINSSAVFKFRSGIYLDSGAAGFIVKNNCFYDNWINGLKKFFVKEVQKNIVDYQEINCE